MKKTLTLLVFVAIAMTINAQTTDMKMLSVRGPVKRIVYTEGSDPVMDVNMATFNRDCWIVELIPDFYEAPQDVALIKRTSYNLLDYWRNYESDDILSDGMLDYKFSYGSNGYVRKVSATFWQAGYDKEITWDETGEIKTIVVEGGGEWVEFYYIYVYEYLKTDRYGNWIEAEYTKYSTTTYYYYAQNDIESVETSSERKKIIRTIEYFE